MIDAWYLLAGRVPTTQAATVPADAAVTRVSWDRIRDCVREHRIGVPIAAAMTLLDAHVGAAVPRDRLDALIAEGARAPRGEHARVVARFATSCAASYLRRRLARTSSAVGPAGPVSSSG